MLTLAMQGLQRLTIYFAWNLALFSLSMGWQKESTIDLLQLQSGMPPSHQPCRTLVGLDKSTRGSGTYGDDWRKQLGRYITQFVSSYRQKPGMKMRALHGLICSFPPQTGFTIRLFLLLCSQAARKDKQCQLLVLLLRLLLDRSRYWIASRHTTQGNA